MRSTGGSCSRPHGPCPRYHPQRLSLSKGQGGLWGLGATKRGLPHPGSPTGSTVSCSPLCHVPRAAEPQAQCTCSPASGTRGLAWSLVPAGVAHHLEARPSLRPEARGPGCGAAQEAVFAWGAVGGRPEPLFSSAGAESPGPFYCQGLRAHRRVPAGRPAPAPQTHTISLSHQVHDHLGHRRGLTDPPPHLASPDRAPAFLSDFPPQLGPDSADLGCPGGPR